MNNNLPIEHKSSVINNLKSFFIRIFKKDKPSLTENREVELDSALLNMKEESKKLKLREDIFYTIRNNQELLNTLTLSQLNEINKLYDEKINEKERKIKRLKRKLS